MAAEDYFDFGKAFEQEDEGYGEGDFMPQPPNYPGRRRSYQADLANQLKDQDRRSDMAPRNSKLKKAAAAAARPAAPKPRPTSGQKLELLLKSITEEFAQDSTSPGLVLSYLPDTRVFYGSIRRYGCGAQYSTSSVQFKAEKITLLEVLTSLSQQWKEKVSVKPETARFLEACRKEREKG